MSSEIGQKFILLAGFYARAIKSRGCRNDLSV